jgi:hypothetical protein
VGLTFSNFSAATVTATAGEKYAMVAIRGFGVLTATLTPSPVLANTIVEQQFTVTGVRAGEVAIVSKPTTQAGLDIMGCRVVSNNLVGITFGNVTAATITPTAGETYSVFSVGGMDATNNELLIQANLNPTALITNIGVTTINVVVSTIAASDTVTGVQKPTAQAGLACTGGFVSAAGAVGLVFCNPTAGALTPLLNEVYGIKVYRPNPVAPCTVISTTLSPSSVAANTTAEQTFTVTGIVGGHGRVGEQPGAAGRPGDRRVPRLGHQLGLHHVRQLDGGSHHADGELDVRVRRLQPAVRHRRRQRGAVRLDGRPAAVAAHQRNSLRPGRADRHRGRVTRIPR